MSAPLEFRVDSATWSQVAAHLARCDDDFVPPLAGRVDIDEYARKIAAHAVRFEAWSGPTLTGLVAMYRDAEARSGFVTSVSVLRERTGEGIGAELMRRCIAHASAAGLRQLRLEVAADNAPALRLYRACGFSAPPGPGAGFVTLVLDMHDGDADEHA